MIDLPANAALILIDVQKGFDIPYWGVRNNRSAEANIVRLLKTWRAASRPVIHVRHMSTESQSPLRPKQPGNDFKDEVRPEEHEHIEEKTVNSAFIGTGLERYLHSNKIETVVLVGLTTDHCVSTTTRMAANLGFHAYVVADACATFNRVGYDGANFTSEEVHACALASLHQEFANVVTTDAMVNACRLSGSVT